MRCDVQGGGPAGADVRAGTAGFAGEALALVDSGGNELRRLAKEIEPAGDDAEPTEEPSAA